MKKSKTLCALALIATLTGCNNNRVVSNTTREYVYAIIKLPSGEIVEGKAKEWHLTRYNDAVEVVFTDGAVYYTHLSNAVLIYSREE